MKLRTKYLLFVFVIHAAALVLSFYIFRQNKIFFIISECVIAFSMLIAWSLYRQLLTPLKFLMQGVDAIRSRDFNVKFVRTGQHEMDELIGVYNHMIDELRKERTRQEEQHLFLEKLIYTSPTGIIVLDHDGRIVQLNPRALFYLGMEEVHLKGKLVSDIEHPLAQNVRELVNTNAITVRVNGVSVYKVQKSHFIDRGFPRQFITIEEMTAEILEAEKRSYGKVIRMMAHEVNNTIGPVNSIIDSALRYKGSSNGLQGDAIREALQVAFERNNNLNVFMRNFADVVRIPTPSIARFDLHVMLNRVVKLMQARYSASNVTILPEFPAGTFHMDGDEQQLEHVIINVIKNGVEASGPGGVVNVRTNSQKGELTVTDNGPGISQEHADQLFSPFFSTKKDGQGIGLTIVKEILMNHGATFSLAKEEEGTVFRIAWK